MNPESDPLSPLFDRRVVTVTRPVASAGTMYRVTLAPCGHWALVFQDTPPHAGERIFCPDCYQETKTGDGKD